MANLQATVNVQTTGGAEVKQLAQDLIALDKSLSRIQKNARLFSTHMGNISKSMSSASRDTAKFATAIGQADAKLSKFRENMKGATGRTKNVTAGINEASFQRAIELAQKLSTELAKVTQHLRALPRSKTINVNAKMTETPVGKTTNIAKEKATNYTNTGFAEGFGNVDFSKIREMQASVEKFKADMSGGLAPLRSDFKSIDTLIGQVGKKVRDISGQTNGAAMIEKIRQTNGGLAETAKKVDDVGTKAKKASGQLKYLMHAVGTSLVLTALFTLPQAFIGTIQASRQLEGQMASIDRMFGEGSNAMKEWAETSAMSFGLSTQQAIEGANQFGNVVRTFAQSSQEMNGITLALMQQVSVVASQTGRTVEDVTKRFISGMLGGTEAIENLGIFVRQTALQATDAYKMIAGTQAWDTLTQAQQNQIYTLAILEQSYARYGGSINPAMLATMQFTAQLQNLRINIGRAFVPVLNAVLPILNKLVSWLSTAMAYVSAFFSLLFGKSASTSAGGAEQSVAGMADAGSDFADSTADSAGNLKDASKAAKEIKRSLAGFDEINLITQTGGDETNGGGGGGGGADLGGIGGGIELPDFGQAGEYITQFQKKVEEVMGVVKRFMELFTPLGIAIGSAFALAWATAGSPLALIAIAIGAIIGIVIDLWNTSEGFRNAVVNAWERIKTIIEIVWVNVLEPFLTGFSEGFMVVYNVVKLVIDIVSQLALGALTWLIDGIVWLLELFGITTEKGSWLAGIFENIGVIVGIVAGVFTAYTVVMGIVSAATTVWSIVTGIATGVAGAFGAVMGFLLSPIGLVILAIGAVIAIIYLLIKNWDWLSEKTQQVWEFVKTWVSDKIEALKESFFKFCDKVKTEWDKFWNGVKTLATNIFTATMNFINKQIDNIVSGFKGIVGRVGDFFSGAINTFKNGISNAWNWVNGQINNIVSWFRNIPSKIGNFIGSVMETMKNSISGAWNWVNRKINDMIQWFKDIPKKIGNSVSGFFGNLFGRSFDINVNGQVNADGLPSNTPYLANGGLAFGKTTAVVGEYAGAKANPEVIAPLDKLTDILVTAVSTAVGNGNNGGQDLYVNLEIDGTRFAKAVVKNVNDYTNATGRKVLKV